MDKIVERKDQKRVIGQILYMHRSHKMNVERKMPEDFAEALKARREGLGTAEAMPSGEVRETRTMEPL